MATYDRTTTTPRWEDYRDTYRSDWENKYGTGRSWAEHEPAYRYGWESSHNWRDRDWHDVESELERGWSDYHGKHRGHGMEAHDTMGGKAEHTWENLKDSVREGWERARLEWNKRT